MDTTMMIKTEDIYQDIKNVRERIGDITELKESMKASGGNSIPIIVCKNPEKSDKKYELLVGFRRWSCAKALGLEKMQATIKENLSEKDKLKIMWDEVQGKLALTWFETAKAFARLMKLDDIIINFNNIDIYKKPDDDMKVYVDKANELHGIAQTTAYRYIKWAKIVKEFPDLQDEKSGSDAERKYKELKNVPEEEKQNVKEGKKSIDAAVEDDKKEKTKERIIKEDGVLEEQRKLIDEKDDKIKELEKKLESSSPDIDEEEIQERVEGEIQEALLRLKNKKPEKKIVEKAERKYLDSIETLKEYIEKALDKKEDLFEFVSVLKGWIEQGKIFVENDVETIISAGLYCRTFANPSKGVCTNCQKEKPEYKKWCLYWNKKKIAWKIPKRTDHDDMEEELEKFDREN